MQTFEAIVGDRATSLFSVLRSGRQPVDLSGSSVRFTMKAADGTTKVDAQAAQVEPLWTFEVDAAKELLRCDNHLILEGDQLLVSSDGDLPAPLSVSTVYIARDVVPHYFRLARYTEDDLPVDITDAGTGVHKILIRGSVLYPWKAADVDTAGRYTGRWKETVTASGLVRSYPVSAGFQIEFFSA
jgi:hypothetical protein